MGETQWSDADHQVLLEVLAEGVVLQDRDGRVVYANPSAARILGIARDRLIGSTFGDLGWLSQLGEAPTDSADGHPAVHAGLALDDVVVEVARPDGESVWVSVNARPVFADGSDSPTGAVVSFVDVTALRRADEEARAAAYRLSALIANMPDMVAVIDEHGDMTYVSPAAYRLLGRRAEDREGRSIFDYVHPDDVGRATEIFMHALAEPGPAPTFEARLRHENGSYRLWEVSANNLLDDPDVRGIIVNSRDITDTRRIEASLHEAERRFEQVFETASVGMNLVSPSGQFLRVNRSYSELVGYPATELLSMTIFDVCHPDDLEWTRSEFAREVAGETDGYQIDNRLRRADGTTVWVRVSATIVRDDDGMPRYGVGLVADITEGHELTERLTYEATHDDLTGVSAPRVLQGSLEHHVAQAQRTGASVAVLLVDLDNFKGVNDAHGHAGGDAVLIETARRIEAQMRPADVVVRKGGDEFVIILAPAHEPGTTADVACLVARRIVDALAEPFTLPGGVAQIGASVGIALSRPGCSGPDALLAEADRAAYEAKRKGRGRYVLRELDRTG